MAGAIFNKENQWFIPLFLQLTVTNLAHFAGLSVLTLTLVTELRYTAAQVALVLVMTSVGLRFSRIALAPFIDRIQPRRVIPLAIVISLAGYVGMAFSTEPFAVAFSMLLVGTGYGLNGMLVSTLASYAINNASQAFSIYALMNTGTNLAAAAAPLVANTLRLNVDPAAPFLFSAGVLCLSLLVCTRIRADIPSHYREVRLLQAIRPLLSNPRFLAVLAMVAAGWAVYTQKFSATPLFLEQALGRSSYVGLAITLNALAVLLLSLPLAAFVRRQRIQGPMVLLAAFTLYALAYGLLAAWPVLPAFWASLALWSLAETLLMPQLNALVAAFTSAGTRLAGFSLAAVAIGIGEAGGNATGAMLMRGADAIQAQTAYAALALFSLLAGAGALLLMPQKAREVAA